ncbi:hypothetical protein HY251_21570 [bacterium]|nr:hypothetical protein [bacterium]
MFICSACGYEGNPDSAPACSLCGAKKPGAEGGAKPSAPAPAKPSKETTGDELAAAAKAVAESTPATAALAKPAAGAKPSRRPETAGVIRGGTVVPLLGTATLLSTAFVGALLAYVVLWARQGHAPQAWTDALIMFAAAVVVGVIGRFALAPKLENSLDQGAAEAFGNLGPGVSALFFFVLACVGLYLASTSTTPVTTGGGGGGSPAVEISGDKLVERIALLTSAGVELATSAQVEFVNKGKRFRVPLGKVLKKADLDEVQKASGIAADRWAVCLANEPYAESTTALPADFSLDAFLAQLADGLRVRRDTSAPTGEKKRINLMRTKAKGGVETLWVVEHPATAGDLQTALPAGIPRWVGVGLGLPHESTSGQAKFVGDLLEKLRPED